MEDDKVASVHFFQCKFILDRILLLLSGRIKSIGMSTQSRKRMENFSAVFHTHTRMFHKEIPVVTRVRQIDDVGVVETRHDVLQSVRFAPP